MISMGNSVRVQKASCALITWVIILRTHAGPGEMIPGLPINGGPYRPSQHNEVNLTLGYAYIGFMIRRLIKEKVLFAVCSFKE